MTHPPSSIILWPPRNPPGKFIYQFFSLQVTVSTICAQNIDFYEKVKFEKSHFLIFIFVIFFTFFVFKFDFSLNLGFRYVKVCYPIFKNRDL